MQKISPRSLYHLAPLALLLAASCGGPSSPLSRVCKPVVPEVNIDMNSVTQNTEGLKLAILYDEEGSPPFTRDTFTNNARFSACTTVNGKCTSSRLRYEIKASFERYQSIQLRKIGPGDNAVVGAIRWKGPSYPDRIEMVCDLDNPKIRRACKLGALHYKPSHETSGKGGNMPSDTRTNDSCTPL